MPHESLPEMLSLLANGTPKDSTTTQVAYGDFKSRDL
jgi:hypothetical protein